MAFSFSEFARINNSALPYYPRFSSSESSRIVLCALFRNSQSTAFDHELASPSDVGNDEQIFQQLNNKNHHGALPRVSNQENDGQIQFKRISQRSDNIGAGNKNGDAKSHFSQKPTFTRIVKRRENLPGDDQNFPGAQPKPNGRFDRAPRRLPLPFYCAFCLSNGETEQFYRSHVLKDDQNRVTCPILQKFICQICGATGEYSHTSKYCPISNKPLPKYKPIRRNAVGKKVVSYN